MNACMYVRTYTHTHTHTYTHAWTHARTHAHTRTKTQKNTQKHTHTHTKTKNTHEHTNPFPEQNHEQEKQNSLCIRSSANLTHIHERTQRHIADYQNPKTIRNNTNHKENMLPCIFYPTHTHPHTALHMHTYLHIRTVIRSVHIRRTRNGRTRI